MRRILVILIPVFLIIFFLHIINIFIYPFPFYLNNIFLNHVFFYSFTASIFLLGIDLTLLNFYLINQKKILFYISFLCLTLSLPTGLITSYVYSVPVSMELEMQSTSDSKQKIYIQHFDYGAFGDSYKRIKTYELLPGFLYIEKDSDFEGE